MQWSSWLRHCAANRKVTGFYWNNLSDRSMVLWSTKPLREMSARNTFWGVKAVSAQGWQLSCVYQLEIWVLILLEPSELVQVCTGMLTCTNKFSPICSGMDIIRAPHYTLETRTLSCLVGTIFDAKSLVLTQRNERSFVTFCKRRD
jgi:hypothetical protein